MGNIINTRLVTTKHGDESQYSAIMTLQYGSVAPTPQVFPSVPASFNFLGNCDLFQMQSLLTGIQVEPIRNIQLSFLFPENNTQMPPALFLFMPDTGELIIVSPNQPPTSELAASVNQMFAVALSVNILPSFQIAIYRSENIVGSMDGTGVICLSTKTRETYWS
jgi:hypothetical protein